MSNPTIGLCEGRKLLKACWDLHGKKPDGTCPCFHCVEAARWLFASFKTLADGWEDMRNERGYQHGRADGLEDDVDKISDAARVLLDAIPACNCDEGDCKHSESAVAMANLEALL